MKALINQIGMDVNMRDFIPSSVLPTFKRLIAKSTIGELKTIEEINKNEKEKYEKIPENERIKLRMVTPELKAEWLAKELNRCIDENMSEYTFNGKPLFEVSRGHEFIKGYFTTYMCKETSEQFRIFYGEYAINDNMGKLLINENNELYLKVLK